MKRLGMLLVCLGLFCSWPLAASAQGPDGEKLVRELWKAMAATDMPVLEKLVADGFQSVHCNGSTGRQGELKILKNLKPKNVVLSEFVSTMVGDSTVIVTYNVALAETIAGEKLAHAGYPRMSIFVKTDKGWQWAAHANPRPLEACLVE